MTAKMVLTIKLSKSNLNFWFSPNCFVLAPNVNNIQGSAAFYLNSSYVIAVQKFSERD